MINKCRKTDESEVLSYINKAYPHCLYLYLDLLKYGIDSELISVYVQRESGEIKAILLKYYSCIHLYSRDNDFDANELADYFSDNYFTIIYCTKDSAERVFETIPQSKKSRTEITTGWVAQIKKVDHEPRGLAVEAKKQDFEQIVRLIYNDDDIGRSYKYDELAKQLEERYQQGYARNLVIKQDNQVIAHVCTNAEYNKIAVVAELLVREEFRRKGYASELLREICAQLLSEEKEVYSFYYSEDSRVLHKHIGFIEICDWAKIVFV